VVTVAAVAAVAAIAIVIVIAIIDRRRPMLQRVRIRR
jgi:hypothetical protein